MTTTTAPPEQHRVAPERVPPARHEATRPARTRHRLDDPISTWGLYTTILVMQLWSAVHLFDLAKWAFGDAWSAFWCVAMYELIGLLAGRVGADERNGTRATGVAVRGWGWSIATQTFAFTFAGNLVSHWIFANGRMVEHWFQGKEGLVRMVLGSFFIPLLLQLIVLHTKMQAYKTIVLAREAQDAQRERTAQQAAEAAGRREAADRDAELEKARLAAELARAAEAAAQAEAERAKAEAAAAAARAAEQGRRTEPKAADDPPPKTTPPPPSADECLPGIPAKLADRPLKWQKRWLEIPGKTQTEKARNWILAEWTAGREPTGPEVDATVGTNNMGRSIIRDLRKEGHAPSSEEPARSLAVA